MANINPPHRQLSCAPSGPADSARRRDFLQELGVVWEDPQTIRLARSRAGDPELAADALQEAYCAVAGLKNYEQIDDLRRYFCRVLINEIYRLRRPGASPVGNPEEVAGTGKGNVLAQQSSGPFDEALCTRLLAQNWLRHLAENRESLARRVPGRSADPRRYRMLIVACAERMVVAMMTKDVSDADSNLVLGTAYPEWFAENSCANANLYQRFKRARDDVRRLLNLIIDRNDLYS